MLLNSGLSFGVKRSLPHWLGVLFGFTIMVLFCVLGISATLTSHAWLQSIIKFAGSGYMLYLAYKMIFISKDLDGSREAKPMTFVQAVLFQWLNPKSWMILISAIGIFITGKSFMTEAFSLTTVLFITTLFGSSSWLLFGASLQRLLKEEKHKKIFNYVMAALLIVSVLLIFIE